MAFVQEAAGKQADELVQSAQSSVKNARRGALQAAYNLFATSLENDQCLHDKFLAASDVSSARARSMLIGSLQAKCLVKPFFNMLFGVLSTSHGSIIFQYLSMGSPSMGSPSRDFQTPSEILCAPFRKCMTLLGSWWRTMSRSLCLFGTSRWQNLSKAWIYKKVFQPKTTCKKPTVIS